MEEDKKKSLARNNAYRLLRERPRSETEVRIRLKDKGYDTTTIDETIEDLIRRGDIDDARFAKLWVDSRMHSNPMGDIVLRHELKEKGVSDAIIEATLEAKNSSYDEYEVAFNMAREKFGLFGKLDRRKAMKRVYDFLLRRGFKFETVKKIIEKLYEDR